MTTATGHRNQTGTPSRLWNRHVKAAVGTAAVAIGALLASTGVAAARESEQQIEADCTNQDVGGDYSTSVNSETGGRTSKCCYEGMTGMSHCDVYYDGEWNDGDSYRDDTPTTPGPVKPEIPGTGPTMPAPEEEPTAPPRKSGRPGVLPSLAPAPALAP